MIALYRGKSLTSRAIRWATWAEYSHAAWLDESTGRVIEAWKRGVTENEFHQNHRPGTPVDFFTVEGETSFHCDDIRRFMQAELGKRYDFWGIMGFVVRRQLGRQDRWFCSELVFAAYAYAGLQLLARVPACKVTPGMLSRSPLLAFDHRLSVMP